MKSYESIARSASEDFGASESLLSLSLRSFSLSPLAQLFEFTSFLINSAIQTPPAPTKLEQSFRFSTLPSLFSLSLSSFKSGNMASLGHKVPIFSTLGYKRARTDSKLVRSGLVAREIRKWSFQTTCSRHTHHEARGPSQDLPGLVRLQRRR